MKNDYDKKEDYEDDAVIVALVYYSNLLVWTSSFSEPVRIQCGQKQKKDRNYDDDKKEDYERRL